MLLIQSPESVILTQMKRSLRQSTLIIVCLCGLSGMSAGQLPEIIGRSKSGQPSGGLIIEPGPGKSRIAQGSNPAPNRVSSPAQNRVSNTRDDSSSKTRTMDWFAILFDGKTVGYESIATTIESPAGKDNVTIVRRQRDTRLQLKRFGSDLSVSAVLETVESPDGLLQSWSLRRTAGDGARLERSGIWNAARSGFDVSETVAGVRKEQFVPAVVHPRSPLFNGWIASASGSTKERWSTAVLFPETNSIADMNIAGQGSQRLVLPTGEQIIINRFDYWPVEAPENKSSIYYDQEGSVVRVEQPLLGQTLILERAETASALGQKTLESLDLEFRVLLPMKRAMTLDETRSTATLKFSTGIAEHLELPTTEFQTVDHSAPGEMLITLTRPVIQEKLERIARPSKVRLEPEFQNASRWITSDDETIKRMGVIVAANSVLPEDKCRRLTDHVFKKMRGSSFSTSLTPANEVARSMQGDCTEYAVLLSALMRSQGVPSRVAIGFVYVPNPPAFAPHMWTEAFIDDKWIPFDATRGSREFGLTHVKVADSSLSDDVASGTVLFVPLLHLLGRTTVDYIPPSDFGAN